MVVIVDIINLLFKLYGTLLVFRIVLSWVPHNDRQPLIQKLYMLTEPYLDLFRALPLSFGGIDFSPVLAFFALGIIKELLLRVTML